MNKKDICNVYRKKYHNYNESYKYIDSNIKPLVDWLRKQGFITFASCGSHIFDYSGNPILCGQAYVSFYYTDEDKDKVVKLKQHRFPRSKFYRIFISEFEPSELGTNRISIDIIFKTRYNRIKHLKKIYDSLGISYPINMKLEKERPYHYGKIRV